MVAASNLGFFTVISLDTDFDKQDSQDKEICNKYHVKSPKFHQIPALMTRVLGVAAEGRRSELVRWSILASPTVGRFVLRGVSQVADHALHGGKPCEVPLRQRKNGDSRDHRLHQWWLTWELVSCTCFGRWPWWRRFADCPRWDFPISFVRLTFFQRSRLENHRNDYWLWLRPPMFQLFSHVPPEFSACRRLRKSQSCSVGQTGPPCPVKRSFASAANPVRKIAS